MRVLSRTGGTRDHDTRVKATKWLDGLLGGPNRSPLISGVALVCPEIIQTQTVSPPYPAKAYLEVRLTPSSSVVVPPSRSSPSLSGSYNPTTSSSRSSSPSSTSTSTSTRPSTRPSTRSSTRSSPRRAGRGGLKFSPGAWPADIAALHARIAALEGDVDVYRERVGHLEWALYDANNSKNYYKKALIDFEGCCKREHWCRFHARGECRFRLDFTSPAHLKDRCHFHHPPTPAPRQPYRPEGNGPRAAARRKTTPMADEEELNGHTSWKKRLRLKYESGR